MEALDHLLPALATVGPPVRGAGALQVAPPSLQEGRDTDDADVMLAAALSMSGSPAAGQSAMRQSGPVHADIADEELVAEDMLAALRGLRPRGPQPTGPLEAAAGAPIAARLADATSSDARGMPSACLRALCCSRSCYCSHM